MFSAAGVIQQPYTATWQDGCKYLLAPPLAACGSLPVSISHPAFFMQDTAPCQTESSSIKLIALSAALNPFLKLN